MPSAFLEKVDSFAEHGPRELESCALRRESVTPQALAHWPAAHREGF